MIKMSKEGKASDKPVKGESQDILKKKVKKIVKEPIAVVEKGLDEIENTVNYLDKLTNISGLKTVKNLGKKLGEKISKIIDKIVP